jgi:hypothetical protein
MKGIRRIAHGFARRLGPTGSRYGAVFEEQAPLRASERAFLVGREPAALEGLPGGSASMKVVATIVANAHGAMLARSARAPGSPSVGQSRDWLLESHGWENAYW